MSAPTYGTPRIESYDDRTRFSEVQFRDASRFLLIRTPRWAQGPARRYCPGALVKTGPLKKTGAWVVQSILIPRSYHGDQVDKALDAALSIFQLVERPQRRATND